MHQLSSSLKLAFTVHYSLFITSFSYNLWCLGVQKGAISDSVENPDENACKSASSFPSNKVITSYAILQNKLSSLGWEQYYDNLDLLQFHKRSTVDLISLPKNFNKFKSMHMHDIVVMK